MNGVERWIFNTHQKQVIRSSMQSA